MNFFGSVKSQKEVFPPIVTGLSASNGTHIEAGLNPQPQLW
jgi:hypothetical protein